MSLLLLLNQPSGVNAVTGNLSASETGLDGLVALAQNLPQGALAGQESGADTCVSDGGTVAKGALSVSESGADTLVSDGDTVVAGAASASESGGDFAAFMGVVLAKGALSASEAGGDSFAANGVVVVPIIGNANATEGSTDFAQFMGKVLVQGALSISEGGSDYARIGEFGFATGGTGETVFAHRMEITVQQPKHTVTSRVKRAAQNQSEAATPTAQKQGSKFAFVYQKQASTTVLTTTDEAYVSTNFEYVL